MLVKLTLVLCRACARNGVHYVDLTGESAWIKDIIAEYVLPFLRPLECH